MKLKHEHMTGIHELRDEHMKDIIKLKYQHTINIIELKDEHTDNIIKLKYEHMKGISELKDEHRNEMSQLYSQMSDISHLKHELESKKRELWFKDQELTEANKSLQSALEQAKFHLLASHHPILPKLKGTNVIDDGSITQTEGCKNWIVQQCGADSLPVRLAHVLSRKDMLEARALPMKMGMKTAEEMSWPTFQALKKLCVGVKVFQTMNTTILQGTGPKLALCLEEATDAHLWAVYGVLELKAKEKVLNSQVNLGQLTNYLVKLAPLQPERTEFWGILSNLVTSTVLIMRKPTTPGNPYLFQRFDNIRFEQAIHFIRSSTANDADSDKVPHLLPFHASLGQDYQRWANSSNWMIAEFPLLRHDGHNNATNGAKGVARMVVKVSIPNANGEHAEVHHLNEIQNLRLITSAEPAAPDSIPKLVWDPIGDILNCTPELIQFGITPVGRPISMDVFANGAQFTSGMEKLLDGLNWLHKHAKIIHRDLRLANVIYDMAHLTPVLIDYDCAWKIPAKEAETIYEGGIICIPHRVLKDYKRAKHGRARGPATPTEVSYIPDPADDLCAYILFIIALIFPRRFSEFRAHEILMDGPEGQVRIAQLERFITDVINSPFWGKWWHRARNNDLDALRTMVREVAVWPWAPPSLSVIHDDGPWEAVGESGSYLAQTTKG